MTDRFGRREFLAAGVPLAAALAGCSGGGAPAESDEAGNGTNRTADKETDGGPETTAEPTTDAAEADSLLPPLPTPSKAGVSRPDGEARNLEILDWAGFESAVSFTFDDGQPSQAAHYDALNDAGARLTFYLTEHTRSPATTEAWRQAAADGHELGNHTVSHPYADLSGGSFGETEPSAAAEIEGCSEYVTEDLGQSDVWTMAAPFGDTEWADPAERADVFLNRTVGSGNVVPGDSTDPYNVPCYMAREGDTAEAFDGYVDSARADGAWGLLLFHAVEPTDQEWYAPIDVEEITASVERAVGFEDVWVDTVASVGAYWRGQRLLNGATKTESERETTWEWTVPDSFPAGRTLRVTVDGGGLSQGGEELAWDEHGYYEVALDAGSLTLSA